MYKDMYNFYCLKTYKKGSKLVKLSSVLKFFVTMKFTVFIVILIFELVAVYSESDSSSSSSSESSMALDGDDTQKIDKYINKIDQKLEKIKNRILQAKENFASAVLDALDVFNAAIDDLNNSPKKDPALLAKLEEIKLYIESLQEDVQESRRKRQTAPWGYTACSRLQNSINLVAIQRDNSLIDLNKNIARTKELRQRAADLIGKGNIKVVVARSDPIPALIHLSQENIRLENKLRAAYDALKSLYKNSQEQFNTHCSISTDLSVCSRVDDIFVSRFYVKSACLVKRLLTYQEALTFCSQHGLMLFTLESLAVQATFLQLLESFSATYDSGPIWINGIIGFNGVWYGPPQTPIIGINWKFGYPAGAGNCLTVAKFSLNDPFGMADSSCVAKNFFYAQYVK